ncbi:MAG: superoxide dismutase [Cu-Zn] SodC [Pseudomonas sp.]|uniref:superoxide dismutase [Cu-Zn] SodC n=1 Tax=Pseudomonas sp. TaxID=306 RepID=UPI0033931B66
MLTFWKPCSIAVLGLCATLPVQAQTLTIPLTQVDAQGQGQPLGSVDLSETPHGLVLTPALHGLTPGIHGFHVHANPSCAPADKAGQLSAAEAAGGHWDPRTSGKHGSPWGDGHLGDLPALLVTADGKAQQPVLAPRLKQLSELKGHALMVHAGGDNHADHPAPLGGGGARIGCGVIE